MAEFRPGYDAAIKWTPPPDWRTAALEGNGWSARPAPPLSRLRVSGDIAAAMERAFAETASETEGFGAATVAKTTRWLPDGMVFAGATEADGKMISDASEAEEGDVPVADALAEAESDEPSSLPAFLSGDAA